MSSTFDAFLAAFAVGFALKAYLAKPKLPQGVQLPPGPTPLPLLGNVLGVDFNVPWVTYEDWGGQYGDMLYIRLFGQDNIIINSEHIARDLLEHRSQNYSHRPDLGPHEVFGLDYITPFIGYNTRWRLHRKIHQQSFRRDAVLDFRPMQEVKARELLLNLLEDPMRYPKHLETHSGSVILSAVYSYEAARQDDHMIKVVKMSTNIIKELKPLPLAIFKLFPSLHRFPSWLPGMGTKRIADLSRKLAADLLNTPFSHTERGLAAGSISSCLVADHLLELDENDSQSLSQKKVLMDSAATALVAGTETTASVLANFILVMILQPDVQEKAHSLIEQVVGTKRLPTFEDRPSLPYVDAILRECLRWHPVTPLGIMHAAVESDIYEGYYIPQGSTVIANIWAMCHNEEKYPNAGKFNPDHFLNPDGTLTDDMVNVVWGFGRRVCPGRHLAEASLWSAMVCLLAVFKFSKAKDETGQDIEFEPQWHGMFTVCPLPFPCSITPRNAGMDIATLQDLIKAV